MTRQNPEKKELSTAGDAQEEHLRQDLVDRLAAVLKDGTTRKKLLAYAFNLVSRRSWPGEGDLRELTQDIVSEAICKTVAGERRWDPETTPDPVDFLFSAVRSTVDARNKNDRNAKRLTSLNSHDAEKKTSAVGLPYRAIEAEDFFCGLIIEIGEDEVCARMLDLYEKGYKPDEIAVELGLPPEDIYAANKRLKRKARAYLQKYHGE